MNSDKLSWLVSQPIASRGLHDQLNGGIPENSIKAFEAAIKKNYSIALNVIVLTDDEVIVFYDGNLQRLCGDEVEVGKLKKNEYQLYKLSGTDQKISCLEDVLHCIDGRVPVLIEIMNYSTNENTNIAVLNTLLGYRGHVAIMSFDPFTLGWFRRFANTIPRGLLGCSFNGHHKNALMRMLLRNFFFNFYCDPDFIAYNIEDLPNAKVERIRKSGKPIIGWIVESQQKLYDGAGHYDNIIFENFQPSTKTLL